MAIDKVLIANRGEIARRVIRAARSLGITTAVVYSDADADAPFVAEADEAVRLPGVLASDTYLVADLIVSAALAVGADAVHPGYGFLSENADFADACAAAGLTFIGPPADAIRRMGDKITAKALMAAAGVPVLASVNVSGMASADVEAALDEVGMPAIIKASAGGGGRGMRIVEQRDELLDALEGAQREAQSAFGDSAVFIERYVSPARHIEVQIVADAAGTVTALFERECSIQRRHQKVVEEAPSPAATPALRERLCTAAVLAAQTVDYRGVGTVEFVVGPDGEFAFLEMNTRLQVEHPVTEAVTGLDLVRLQFQVADGERLDGRFDDLRLHGHAIEVRLCAEDPAVGFLPCAGRFLLFEISGDGVRVDSSVVSGSEISPHYDSMVAKVIAWGETRRDAARLLADSLQRARIHGVATNRDLLVRILQSEAFLAGDTTTDFLQRVEGLTEPLTAAASSAAHAIAAALAVSASTQGSSGLHAGIPTGWRNNRSSLDRLDLAVGDEPVTVEYDVSSPAPVAVVDGHEHVVGIHALSAEVADLTLGGIRRRYTVAVVGGFVLVDSPLGSTSFALVDRFPIASAGPAPGSLSAPMPGVVVRVLVAPGEQVAAGQPLLVLEAMKMEHTIASPREGEVSAVNVKEGDQVERGMPLVEVTEP